MPRSTSITQLEGRIAKLQLRAARLRAKQKAPVIQAVISAIHDYQITPEDLGISATSRGPWDNMVKATHQRHGRRRIYGPVAPKYRHPKTGETWTGRGRTARWLAEEEKKGKNREEFLVA